MNTSKAITKIVRHDNYTDWYIVSCQKSGEPIDTKFVQWINRVEKDVKKVLGCHLLDIPDEDYRMFFENGGSPRDMADYVIQNNRYLIGEI